MIKRIKRIFGDGGDSVVRGAVSKNFLLTLFLGFIAYSASFAGEEIISKEEAIKIAMESARISQAKMAQTAVTATKGSGSLPNDHGNVYSILNGKSWWKIVFKPKAIASDGLDAHIHGGEIFVVVDSITGKTLVNIRMP